LVAACGNETGLQNGALERVENAIEA